jgi:hypothetical protein
MVSLNEFLASNIEQITKFLLAISVSLRKKLAFLRSLKYAILIG